MRMRRAVAARFSFIGCAFCRRLSSLSILAVPYVSWCVVAVSWLVLGHILYPIDSCMSSPIVISPRESPIVISSDSESDGGHDGESSGLVGGQKVIDIPDSPVKLIVFPPLR